MKIIDLSLFNKEPEFGFKAISGKEYIVNFVNAENELTLMQEQEDIAAAISKWKNIKIETLDKWKQILKKLLRECNNNYNTDEIEKDVNALKPIHILTILFDACKYLNERAQILYEVFPDDTKKQAKKLERELKKKAASALSESEA